MYEGLNGPQSAGLNSEIEGYFNDNAGVVKSNSIEDTSKNLIIKLSHMIKPRSVDRFEIKVSVNKPKGNKCVNGAQVKGVVNIYYDESGQISSEVLKIWLSTKNESAMN